MTSRLCLFHKQSEVYRNMHGRKHVLSKGVFPVTGNANSTKEHLQINASMVKTLTGDLYSWPHR